MENPAKAYGTRKNRMSQSEKASENAPRSCGGNVESGKTGENDAESGAGGFPQGVCGEKIQYDILVEKCEEKRAGDRTNDREIFFRQGVEMCFHKSEFPFIYKEKWGFWIKILCGFSTA